METTRQFPWTLILVVIMYILYRGHADTWSSGDDVIILSMMNDSAAYIYTQSEETDSLAIKYLETERKNNNVLNETWMTALSIYNGTNGQSKFPVPQGLSDAHVVAIIAYTLESELYRQFNEAVMKYGANDAVYAEKFPFKSFQYLLSVAINRLRENLGKPPQPTYRRMNIRSTGKVGDRIKFGYFASSSRKKKLEGFGKKTIITIFSQYGAQIQNYSIFPDEEEVLIPPYEAFKITSYEPRPDGVDITLRTDGVAGIPVRVERGSNGEMRVLRYEETSMSLYAWLAILTPLALFLGRYR